MVEQQERRRETVSSTRCSIRTNTARWFKNVGVLVQYNASYDDSLNLKSTACHTDSGICRTRVSENLPIYSRMRLSEKRKTLYIQKRFDRRNRNHILFVCVA